MSDKDSPMPAPQPQPAAQPQPATTPQKPPEPNRVDTSGSDWFTKADDDAFNSKERKR